MSISLNSSITSVMNQLSTTNSSSAKATSLQNQLSNLEGASDEELMDVCKSFESYFLEKVMENVKDAMVPEDEDEENDYVAMFGDQLYEKYAEQISENGELGLAQQLYEAMKREYGGTTAE